MCLGSTGNHGSHLACKCAGASGHFKQLNESADDEYNQDYLYLCAIGDFTQNLVFDGILDGGKSIEIGNYQGAAEDSANQGKQDVLAVECDGDG